MDRTMTTPSTPEIDRFPNSPGPSVQDASGETTTIRLPLDLHDPLRLEALKAARRAMIREEWMLGLDEGGPSLLDAEFSASGIVWDLPLAHAPRAHTRLAALVRRAEAAVEMARRVTA